MARACFRPALSVVTSLVEVVAVLLVVAYILAGMFAPETAAWPEPVKQARSLPFIAEGARIAVEKVPEHYRPRLVPPPVPPGPTVDDLLRPPARTN